MRQDCCSITTIPSEVYQDLHPTFPCEHCPIRSLMFSNSTAIVLNKDLQAITRFADVLTVDGYPPIEKTSFHTTVTYCQSRYGEAVMLLEDLVAEINQSNINHATPIKK